LSAVAKCKVVIWLLLCLLSPLSPLQAQQDVLFGLDARFSQIVRFDPDTGSELARFPSPVLCRPEGACGTAYSGHSLFMVDATDPDMRIYEFSADDGAIWHSLPAPPGGIDALAYAEGVLYALNFNEDLIYALDPFDGSVLRVLDPGVDLVGGLGVMGERLYASRIRPPAIFEIDAQSGEVLTEWVSPSALPTGIAALGGRLFVSDFSAERLLEINGQSGRALGELALGTGNLAALAAGRPSGRIPYNIRLERVGEKLRDDGLVQLDLLAALYDDEGRLLQTNDHSELRFVLSGDVEAEALITTSGGQALGSFALDPGVEVVVEVQLSGLQTAVLPLRVVSPAVRVVVEFVEDREDAGLVAIEAHLIDATEASALDDTSEVSFAILSGRAVLAGAATAQASNGLARTWLRTDGLSSDIRVEVRLRSIVAVAVLHAGGRIGTPAQRRAGLALSANVVAGRDEIPPSPVVNILAQHLGGGMVELSWDLVAEDGVQYWVPYGGQFISRNGLEGYRILRSADGGLWGEVASLKPGANRFVDQVDPNGGPYVYQVLSTDADNWRVPLIVKGSVEDLRRTVVIVSVGIDAEGQPVLGLFDDDFDVDFDDFFLFIDVFGSGFGDGVYDGRFDLDGDGAVGLDDFFLFADFFGKEVVSR